MSTVPEEKTTYRQQGIYEKLLCSDCERRINDFEKHARRLFFEKMEYHETGKANEVRVINLDYCRFKLFQLSVLWRAGVAKDPAFSAVILGNRHEERIRNMLLCRNPGEPHEYGCIVFGLFTTEEGVFRAFMKPEHGRLGSHHAYRFVFGSCGWVFLVSRHTEEFDRKKYFLTKEGTLLMRFVPAKEVPFIISMVEELRKSGKLG